MTEVEHHLVDKAIQGVKIIEEADFRYVEYGLFGSVARGDFDGTSDVDFVMIVDEIPDSTKIAITRSKLEEIKCDFAVLLKSHFDMPNSVFEKAVKRDYRRLKVHGQ